LKLISRKLNYSNTNYIKLNLVILKNNCNFIGCDISKKALHIGKKRLKYYSKNKIDLFEKNKTKIGQ
jgi:ubiquinone/menaquinone biosynthesis C-methylase UbiE